MRTKPAESAEHKDHWTGRKGKSWRDLRPRRILER